MPAAVTNANETTQLAQPTMPEIGNIIVARSRTKTGETTQSFIVTWVEPASDGNGWYVGMQPSGRADSMTGAFGATYLRVTPKKFGTVAWAIAP